jgi:hypothetical protein
MAKDIFHQTVKEALEKDGWLITHDPYKLKTDLLDDALEIDFGAERLIAAQKGKEKIAIEVKSFLRDSLIYEFHSAMGQLFSYQINLDIQEPERLLYLAIPTFAYQKMKQHKFYEVAFQRHNIRLIIFEPNNQIIEKWLVQS